MLVRRRRGKITEDSSKLNILVSSIQNVSCNKRVKWHKSELLRNTDTFVIATPWNKKKIYKTIHNSIHILLIKFEKIIYAIRHQCVFSSTKSKTRFHASLDILHQYKYLDFIHVPSSHSQE